MDFFCCCILGAGRYIPPTGSSQQVSDVAMGGGSVDPFTGTQLSQHAITQSGLQK